MCLAQALTQEWTHFRFPITLRGRHSFLHSLSEEWGAQGSWVTSSNSMVCQRQNWDWKLSLCLQFMSSFLVPFPFCFLFSFTSLLIRRKSFWNSIFFCSKQALMELCHLAKIIFLFLWILGALATLLGVPCSFNLSSTFPPLTPFKPSVVYRGSYGLHSTDE